MYFALFYDTVDDFIERRQAYRQEHLALAEQWHRNGRLLLAGALSPPDGALLVFRADAASEVEEFVGKDPYVINGLITAWRVREWSVVIGGETLEP